MKHLGIDFGAKHIGLALSDQAGRVAMPHAVIPNDGFTLSIIQDLVFHQGVEKIVVGRSDNLSMGYNDIQEAIDQFSDELSQELNVPVEHISEIFSSRQARWGVERPLRRPHLREKRGKSSQERRIDDRAATIILQSYLDGQGSN